MAGLFKGFSRTARKASSPTDAEFCAEQEKFFPGFTERWQRGKRDLAARNAARDESSKKTFGKPFNVAAEASNLAAYGALDPKVAFLLGAPGGPNGTGQLVSQCNRYKG